MRSEAFRISRYTQILSRYLQEKDTLRPTKYISPERAQSTYAKGVEAKIEVVITFQDNNTDLYRRDKG